MRFREMGLGVFKLSRKGNPGLGMLMLLLGCFVSATAQVKCTIKHYSTEDGLSHEKTTCIIKDRDGFMWFGTWDGLNRFDGHSFIIYKSYSGDGSNLKNNRINEIVEGQGAYLWVRTDDKQVYRFDKTTGEFIEVSQIMHKSRSAKYLFDKMAVSRNGQVWLLSKQQGVIAILNSGTSYHIYSRELTGKYHLPSNEVKFFREDDQQNIWVGTSDGLCRLSPDPSGVCTSNLITNSSGLVYNCISMSEDRNDVVFVTKDGYLMAYNKKNRHFSEEKRITNNELNAVLISAKNNVIYCATSAGELLIINKLRFELKSVVKADTGAIYSLYEDRAGLVWIEPKSKGIIKYNPANHSLKHFMQKVYSDYPNGPEYYQIFEDNRGNVWANMRGGGFGYYNTTSDTIDPFFNDPASSDYQFSNKVNYQYYDPAGVLWLSTEDRGIEKIVIQENDFRLKVLVDHSLVRSDNEVRAVYSDREGRLWVASKRKLYVFKNGKEVPDLFINKPYNIISQIYCILEDHDGIVWLGTKGDGLFKAEPLSAKKDKYQLSHYLSDDKDINSLSSHTIYDVLEDQKKRIWIGTYGGGLNQAVTKNHQTQFNSFKNAFKNYPKGPYQRIRHLEEDAKGNLWIGTTDGLLILDATGEAPNFRYTHFDKIPGDKESLGNNDIQFICKDQKNRMWLSTSGGGLNVAMGDDPFKSLKFKSFTIKDGLPNDFILSTVEDNKGNLWVATQRGISKFNIATARFKNYDSYDGLPQSGFSEGTCVKLPNGELIFGAIQGYLLFDPTSITDRRINANMALTNLQVNGRDAGSYQNQFSVLRSDINYTDDVILNYNQNTLSVDYGVLDFRSNSKQIYAYRLNGVDTAWNKSVINHHKVTYSNLAPGKYLFQVRSNDEELYLNTPYKSLSIIILPPPWRTWWAYLIYGILALVIFELARRVAVTLLKLRQRIAVQHRLTELKMNFFTNISHELRTPLSLIINPADAILRKEELSVQGEGYARVILKNANRMVRFINQLLDLRKVESGKAVLHLSEIEIISFIKNIGEYFTELGQEREVSLNISSDVKELFAWADAEKFDIILYNILANAFKFTDYGTEIKVIIKHNHDPTWFTIMVTDQGTGVATDKLNNIFELYYEGEPKQNQTLKGTGIGLALSKELVNLHHGKIHAENNPDKGLSISIAMKLGKAHFSGDHIVFTGDIAERCMADSALYDKPMAAFTTVNEQNITGLPLVLLIEDNHDLRKFLSTQLGEYYQVVEAANGEEGWQKATELIPDLILSDVMMPKMNGIELLDKLKNHIQTSHIPFILLSARSSIENQIEGLEYGADYYITKPFDTIFLLTSIKNLITQRKKIFESILKGKSKPGLNADEIKITSKDELFLKKTIEIVENGMSDSEFNIDSVTELIGMSRSAFYKKLKSLTDLSPVEFLREMRLTRGKKLLDAGEDNISQVAYAVGFTDPKYFGACFKKQFHVLPSEYIKNLRAAS